MNCNGNCSEDHLSFGCKMKIIPLIFAEAFALKDVLSSIVIFSKLKDAEAFRKHAPLRQKKAPLIENESRMRYTHKHRNLLRTNLTCDKVNEQVARHISHTFIRGRQMEAYTQQIFHFDFIWKRIQSNFPSTFTAIEIISIKLTLSAIINFISFALTFNCWYSYTHTKWFSLYEKSRRKNAIHR